MPFEHSFTIEEWSLLRETPFKVILAAVAADVRGPIGAASTEMVIGARSLVTSATARFAGNSLIMGILTEVAEDPANESEISLDDEQARLAATVEAIAFSQNASVALAAHADQIEAEQYKQWVFDAAAAVAEATRSGGILGFGSVKVSEKEQEFLNHLRIALGLSESSDEAEAE